MNKRERILSHMSEARIEKKIYLLNPLKHKDISRYLFNSMNHEK
jgi:hypothetical protein